MPPPLLGAFFTTALHWRNERIARREVSVAEARAVSGARAVIFDMAVIVLTAASARFGYAFIASPPGFQQGGCRSLFTVAGQENHLLNILRDPRPYLFFTGKGGVGKSSLACATALSLADRGKSVLLVSTDPASNLDEMLGQKLSTQPTPIPGAPGLSGLNIDPIAAADAYRERVIAQMGPDATDEELTTVREELAGACTTEIASFGEFVGLLDGARIHYDHVIFDTAPSGHTLRLLSLPKAWAVFLEGNERGASCIGPHSGLAMQQARFEAAVSTLADPRQSIFVLVLRPEKSALAEAARTSSELKELGLGNQCVIVNQVFHASLADDPVARSLEEAGLEVLEEMPSALRMFPRDEVPLRGFDMVGLDALRAVLPAPNLTSPVVVSPPPAITMPASPGLPGLDQMVDEIAGQGRGLIMVMGKGGVGKTTVASALAVGLVERGHNVHLSTTDPAAHLLMTLEGRLLGLRVDRIDPKTETEAYTEKVIAQRGKNLDEQGRALLREDLRSPCTEEVAVFHAFSRIVSEARSAFVVLDTAPTGHTLLLMDATGAYHREMMRNLKHDPTSGRVVTPLMRLQDPQYSHLILVTVPETTPVSEAAALQEDLRRANIEPFAWVINRTLLSSGTQDPLLRQRMSIEQVQIERVCRILARKTFVISWQPTQPVGIAALKHLASKEQAPGQSSERVMQTTGT
jgi:arsenite/tail-anchored protein-transporting ATPase